MTALEVIDPGPLALVEDLGRPGHAHLGVSPSGAVDRAALRLANRLVGNPEGAAGLELTLGGLLVRALGPVTVALTGAVADTRLDGRAVPWCTVLELPDTARLQVGTPPVGVRCYLAVRGGLAGAAVLGSLSTDVLGGLGPAPVAAGDRLAIGPPPTAWPVVDHAPWGRPVAPDGEGVLTVDLLPGPQADWFVDPEVGDWRVDVRSDRVAVRLTGRRLRRRAGYEGRELPSAGLVRGAVQAPPSGELVVFLADHPVTGGYPVVGVVPDGQVDRLGQLRPGHPVRWRPRP